MQRTASYTYSTPDDIPEEIMSVHSYIVLIPLCLCGFALQHQYSFNVDCEAMTLPYFKTHSIKLG